MQTPPAASRSRRPLALLLAAALASGALVAVTLYTWWSLGWARTAPPSNPAFGINFECDHAEFLLLEDPALGEAGHLPDTRPGRVQWCAQTLARLLQDTGAPHLRLSARWSDIEPREGTYDFTLIDALLAEASSQDVRVLLTVGMKGQRHPEYFIPPWLLERLDLPHGSTVSDNPELRRRALAMVDVTVRHTASSPAIDSWGAENEPQTPSARASEWLLGRDYIQDVVATIRTADPQRRPAVINQGQHHLFDRYGDRWRTSIDAGDVFAISLYPYRNFDLPGLHLVIPITELGSLGPSYAYHSAQARAAGRQYWITEMQAEPWVTGEPRAYGPQNPAPNLDIARLNTNMEYARRTGATRVYLWGAEWWLFQQDRYADPSWMQAGRQIIASGEATNR